ncbi:alkaline phosphatase D family protein [Deinococcus radiophilus]|uniref:Alkaline phosphatase n=1 Tax=Deinococcus radiophilus TaxID=32062 RepID=A0A3S0L4H7_9DEIO|nr:alkaline phosphatase D family protein [Deinococcus radiophilus]RTR26836.1 alkaline phosphatase [Deinococcus radiophilus]UFA51799.1 alkaline phosphatase D family protein [Deinococcus radiophilus]
MTRPTAAHPLSRRAFLQAAAIVTGSGLLSLSSCAPALHLRYPENPFTLGIASGDPLADSVVLWTRLSLDPLGPTGAGLPGGPIDVTWEVAHDEAFRQVVQQGRSPATPERGYAVHAEVYGLEPHRVYYYRFHSGNATSPVGRTRTLPRAQDNVQELNLAFVSCSDYQNGYFGAYRALAQDELDLVVHLGDYIYEYGPNPEGVRQHSGPEIVTLEDYRRRYAQYHADPDLQAAHASAPWVVVWDDHEVENNYAAAIMEARASDEAPVSEADFLTRRAAAYQAYYENLPLRRSSLPKGADMGLYRRFSYGQLASFSMLDTRQYRTDQPCGDGFAPACAAVMDPNATLTGPQQERWLLEGLQASQARWNAIGQQVMMARYDWPFGEGVILNMDGWDGYHAARGRLLGFMAQGQVSNPVVLTGDIHSAWVHDLKADFLRPESATVGTELVTTSISADFPAQFVAPTAGGLKDNPHTRYFNGAQRGYARARITPDTWQTDFRVISDVKARDAAVSTDASWVIEHGRAGAQRA